MNLNAFIINNISIASTTIIQPSLIANIASSLSYVYLYLCGYFCPVVVILTTINSSLCLIVFIFSKEFYSKTSKNSRLYCILLAFADFVAVYTIPFPYFFGDGLNTITNGALYW